MKSILLEAYKLIHGDRKKQYGTWKNNYTKAAKIASVLLGFEITAAQCIIVIFSIKIARGLLGGKRDTKVDAAGYLDGLDQIEQEIKE